MERALRGAWGDVESPGQVSLGGRRNGWVVLDKGWAARLGVQRTGGVYRIRHRDLLQRLAALRGEPPERVADRSSLQKPPRILRVVRYRGTAGPLERQITRNAERY